MDLLDQTGHDELAIQDFRRVQGFGIRTVRTGARWHRIESIAGQYDFRSLDTILRAAQETGVELLLDLLHFGWPDHLDILDESFPRAFSRYVQALVQHMRRWPGVCRAYAPVNEISFLSWAGGDVANLYPHLTGQAKYLKAILVRSAVLASEILLNEIPGVRLIAPEPVINIVGRPDLPGDDVEAEMYRLAQYEAWDMLSGRLNPEWGGRSEYLDILGVNFYDRNQWVHHRENLYRTDVRYKPFRLILEEVWTRYGRPVFVSETGAEDDARADWFRYVCGEVRAARQAGVPVEGICLYPILNHPGWEDDRHCCNGLFDYADEHGERKVHQPLADEILIQQEQLRGSGIDSNGIPNSSSHLFVSSALGFRAPATATPDEQVCS